MNSRLSRLYLLLPLIFASCVAHERHTATIERTWPAGEIHRVYVSEANGSVNVEAGKADEISLVAHIRGYKKPDAQLENQGYFKTEVSGDTLRIGNKNQHRVRLFGLNFGDEATIDYSLRVPPALELELKTVNGRIATKGVDGATQAKSVNGEINLECAGISEVDAHTVNGRVMATFLRDFQGAKLKTVNGRVVAVLPANASFACDLSQVNGDFEASFPLSIHSHPGSRRVSGEVNGGRHELRISTVNGDIHLENKVPPVPPAPPAPPASLAPPVPPVPPANT